MAAGSIIIDLLMRTGAFETDTDRAAKKLKAFQKQAEETGKTIGLAVAGGITLAAAAFDQLVKAAADFKDLEETIGSSAEDIASLSIAAATAGVSMESVTGATIKLTKGLTGVDDESKAAGAALKALGLNIEEFKQLDPVAQYEAVGKALAGFADGAQKTAVAVALFGKSGAEQLRVFKALEEQGGRQVVLTQQQIDLADAYADAQAKQVATIKLYAQAAATDMLPALNDLIGAAAQLTREFSGVDAAGRKLSADSPVKEFANSAVDALAFVVDAADGVARVFKVVANGFAGIAAIATAAVNGDFAQIPDIFREVNEEEDRILTREWFSQRVEGMRKLREESERFAKFQNDPRELARRGRGPAALPELQFDGAAKTAKEAKEKTTEADRYIEALDRQLQKTRELTEVERVMDDIVNGRFKGAKAFQAATALAKADEIDRARQLVELDKLRAKEEERMADVQRRLGDEGRRIFEATRTPAEAYANELERVNILLQAGAIDAETYARYVHQLQDAFDENAQRMKAIAQAINGSVEGAFTNAFADFITGAASAKDAFKSFATSVINDLARIAAQDLARKIIGADSSGAGGLGGFLSQFFGGNSSSGSGGGFGTGAGYGNQDYGAFLATGTNYVPYDGFKATLHKGEAVVPQKYNPAAGSQRGDSIQIVSPPGVPLKASQAEQQQQPDGRVIKRIVLATLTEDADRGGPYSKKLESRFGLKPQLPRRGT